MDCIGVNFKTKKIVAKKGLEVVKLEEKVSVIGTGKYSMQKGKKYDVHPIQAKKLIEKGAAEKGK